MVRAPDDFDYALNHLYHSIRHLRAQILRLGDDECADAIACYHAINDLLRVAEFLNPTVEDWPDKVIRFPIERRC